MKYLYRMTYVIRRWMVLKKLLPTHPYERRFTIKAITHIVDEHPKDKSFRTFFKT